MKYHKLRIAWSVAWGVVAVLLAVLWVRSFWWGNSFVAQIAEERPLWISSYAGAFRFATHWDIASAEARKPGDWRFFNSPIAEDGQDRSWFEFRCELQWNNWVGINIVLPQWVVVIACGLFTTLPLLRFSLRTLLIATTLVAVALGLIIYATRG